MRLKKPQGPGGYLEKVAEKTENPLVCNFFLLAMECSDLSLMREKKPEREGGGGRRCCGGNVSQQRWCLSCCTVAEHLSSLLAAPEPPSWDGHSSHSFVPGSPPLSALGACWGCSKSTGSSNEPVLMRERSSLSLQFIELLGIKADTGSPICSFTHKMVFEEQSSTCDTFGMPHYPATGDSFCTSPAAIVLYYVSSQSFCI